MADRSDAITSGMTVGGRRYEVGSIVQDAQQARHAPRQRQLCGLGACCCWWTLGSLPCLLVDEPQNTAPGSLTPTETT
jgi:hypothetical protein